MIISLFSGAGGADIGFEQAGLNIIASQDLDKDCIKTQLANNRNIVGGNIVELINKDPSCSFLTKQKDIIAIVAGPPCQSFSTAGNMNGINEPRGQLFNQFTYVVNRFKPRFFIFENVRGITSAISNNINVVDLILSEFNKIGYTNTISGIVNSVNYGTPQFRDRFIIIGSYRKEDELFLPIPTHFQKHQNKSYKWNTVDVIKNLSVEHEYIKVPNSKIEIMKLIPEGGNWKDLSLDKQKEVMGEAYNSKGGRSGFFRRLSYSQPSPTLTTSPHQKSTYMYHPVEDRVISVQESAKLQGFPDDYIFVGKTASKYKQIGNAIPTQLAKALGETLLSIIGDNHTITTKRKA